MARANRDSIDAASARPGAASSHAEHAAVSVAAAQQDARSPRKSPPLAQDSTLPAELRDSFAHCHQVTRQRARNFYYGLKLLPEPKRSAMYAIYAFMRACDDLADGVPTSDHSREGAIRRIDNFHQQMQQAIEGQELPEGEPWPAFRYVVQRYGIDPRHFHDMLAGQRQDLVRTRYETFDDLFEYCQKVASSVGLVCLAVWGHDGDAQCKTLATYRGIALQLTNILRDVREDAQRGRVYLPQGDLRRFGYTDEELRRGVVNDAFRRLMMFQIERAQNYYDMSAPLEQHIAPDCRATSWAMTGIYRGLLDRITRDPGRALTQRIRLSSMQKMSIAMRAAWRHWWRTGKHR